MTTHLLKEIVASLGAAVIVYLLIWPEVTKRPAL